MNRTHLLIVLAVLVIAIAAWAGFHRSTQRATITIGMPFILSGDFTSYGEQSRDAVNLAVSDFEAAHPGVSVNAIFEDTHADPKLALGAYQKLVNVDRVDAIVGPLLQTEIGVIDPVISSTSVPVFSLASLPVNERGRVGNPLVIWPDPTRESEQMAQYVYGQGIRSIGVLGTQDAWESEVAKAFSAKFTALGGTVTGPALTLPDSKDDRDAVTKIVSSHPQAVFFSTYYKFFDFVTEAHRLGYTGKLYSIEIDTNLARQTSGLSDGLEFISPNFYTADFVNRYKAKYGELPTLPAGQAYDAAALALQTLYQSHEDRAATVAAMAKMTSYSGVSGTITFDHARATFPLSIFQIMKGDITKIN